MIWLNKDILDLTRIDAYSEMFRNVKMGLSGESRHISDFFNVLTSLCCFGRNQRLFSRRFVMMLWLRGIFRLNKRLFGCLTSIFISHRRDGLLRYSKNNPSHQQPSESFWPCDKLHKTSTTRWEWPLEREITWHLFHFTLIFHRHQWDWIKSK